MNITQLAGVQIDEYTLINMLGTGGMSAVYRAYQEELDRYVAMKLLSDSFTSDPSYMTRFEYEAKMAAALEHPHIVPVYDFGTYEKSSYVVMRLLRSSLEDRMNGSPPLTVNSVLRMLESVADALDYAHSRGIVHRDIKPSNIMFDERGIVYLVDFGIAKATQTDAQLTSDNVILGTPAYMAPEQWRDEAITPAIDQYALSAVMFKVLTGRLPFESQNSTGYMYAHLNAEIPNAKNYNNSLPLASANVLKRGMAKDPSERYASVSAFASALINALSGSVAEITQEFEAVADVAEVTDAVDVQPDIEQEPESVEAPIPDMTQRSPRSEEPRQPARTPPPRSQSAPAANYRASYAPQSRQSRPIPRRQSKKTGRQNTMMVQVARGGIIGLGILFALIIISLLIILALFAPEAPSAAPTAAPTQAAAVQENTEIIESPVPTQAEIGITSRAPLQTPQIIGINPSQLEQVDTLIAVNPVPVRDALYSPDGVMLAAADGSGVVHLWREGANNRSSALIGHSDVASALSFSPDGQLLASGGRDNTVILWNVATGELIRRLQGHTNAVRDVDFNTDGSLLASAGEDGTVRIWNVGTGAVEHVIDADDTRVLAVSFSPLGGVLASGGADGRVRLWRVDDGSLLRNLSGHGEEVRSIVFSSDGTFIASGSADNSIILWRFDNGERLHTLGDHNQDVFVVTFSPDGSLLASGGRDNNIRVFDVVSGTQLTVLTGNLGWILGLDFAPDGTRIVSGGGDGSVRLYGIP